MPDQSRSTQSNGIAPGQVWQSKRRGEGHRRVYINGVSEDGWWIYVRRNTSRRRQAINAQTLRKDYRYVGEVGDV